VAAQSIKPAGTTNGREEFFIVSSVDITKKQLLLKEPTEITQLIQVSDKTRYADRTGKPMQFGDLRAGDTIYIRSSTTSAGRVAVSIRKGPMTLQELQRHYLK
jgi:3-dehydroquinate synthase class II